MLGVDCEWKPNIIPFTATRVALFQIGDTEEVFLINMITMSQVEGFDSLMAQVMQKHIVGMAFNGDA